MIKAVTKYSEQELKEFQEILESKLATSKRQLFNLYGQLEDINDNKESGYDPDDASNSLFDMEFLQEMIHRQEKHIYHLEHALVRVKNKTFGICVVTGTLIDKRRLMAVPTTTKSLAAKLTPLKPQGEQNAISTDPQKRVMTKKKLKLPPNLFGTNQAINNDLMGNLIEEAETGIGIITIPFDEEMGGLV